MCILSTMFSTFFDSGACPSKAVATIETLILPLRLSSSMEPNLLVGDRLFVSKYSYGYSKHSFPFSLPLFKGRILSKTPKRGDVIVFKTPADNRTDYIKRLIGLPGDKIKFIDGDLHIQLPPCL